MLFTTKNKYAYVPKLHKTYADFFLSQLFINYKSEEINIIFDPLGIIIIILNNNEMFNR